MITRTYRTSSSYKVLNDGFGPAIGPLVITYRSTSVWYGGIGGEGGGAVAWRGYYTGPRDGTLSP